MPQSSDFMRGLWGGVQGVGEDKAMAHLHDQGFIFAGNGVIHAPAGWEWTDERNTLESTWGAILFLIEEWDYDYSDTPYAEARSKKK